MTSLRYIALYVTVCLLASCKTSRQLVPNIHVDRSNSELYQSLYSHNTQFDWFVAQGKLNVQSPEQGVSAKVYLRMKNDSIIWSVVKKLAVEGGRMLITPNSYAMVNRIDRTYTRGSTDEVINQFAVDLSFTQIQQLLSGNIILPDTTNMNIRLDQGTYYLKEESHLGTMLYAVNSEQLTLSNVSLEATSTQSISVDYSDYRSTYTGSDLIPYKRSITITDNGISTVILLDFDDIKINEPKSTKFSIPPHYEEMQTIY